MNAHDFAKGLLEGPNLPLLIPKVIEWDDSDDCCTEPVVTKEQGRITATDEPCDVLILSYRDGVPSLWGQKDDIAIEAAKECVEEMANDRLVVTEAERANALRLLKSYMKQVLNYERFLTSALIVPVPSADSGAAAWREKHRTADHLIASKKSGRLFAAVYYEPSAADEVDREAFWRSLNAQIEGTGL